MKTEPTEALKNLIREVFDAYDSDGQDIENIVDYESAKKAVRSAFEEGQSNPKIKQLEWDFYGLYYDVKKAVGHYMILQGDEQYLENHSTCTLTYNGNLMAEFDSVDDAKAAAQEHFEKRIKECLE